MKTLKHTPHFLFTINLKSLLSSLLSSFLRSFWISTFTLSIINTPTIYAQTQQTETKQIEPKQIIINLSGVDEKIEHNIRARLSLAQKKETDLTKAQVKRLFQHSEEEITIAIQPFGYYAPTVTSDLQQTPDTWIANYTINLGPPTQVKTIEFKIFGEGETNTHLTNLFSDFTLKEGELCAHAPYEESKKAILTKVVHSGYLDATYHAHEIKVDLDNHQCHITLHLDTKQQYHFSDVSFSGSKLDDSFLQRFVPYQNEAPYTPENVLNLQYNLEQSNYFKEVELDGAIEPTNLLVPIDVKLEDAKPNQYLLGIGYGTDTGIRGKVGYERRRVNRWGHRFSTDVQIAEIYNRLQAQYLIPGKHPNTDAIKLSGRFIEDEFNEKFTRIHEFGISETRDLFGWQRTIALTYQNERFEKFNQIDKEHSSLLLPSLKMTRVTSDDPANPTHGKRVTFSLSGAWNVLVSDTNFVQADIQHKWIHQAGRKGTWIFRTEFGATFPDDIERLPLSQRFYAGGDESIRGFAYRSLPSERDENGILRPVGGAYLGIASLEYAHKITDKLSLSAFCDAGNAFKNSKDNVQVGTGLGLRYKTPLGPIRFEIAKPLTDAADSLRLHAAFGPEL